jgi:hypothetical protein
MAGDSGELWMGKAEVASACGERKPMIIVCTCGKFSYTVKEKFN